MISIYTLWYNHVICKLHAKDDVVLSTHRFVYLLPHMMGQFIFIANNGLAIGPFTVQNLVR